MISPLCVSPCSLPKVVTFKLRETDMVHDRIVEPTLVTTRAFSEAIHLLYASLLYKLECFAVVGADMSNPMAVIRQHKPTLQLQECLMIRISMDFDRSVG